MFSLCFSPPHSPPPTPLVRPDLGSRFPSLLGVSFLFVRSRVGGGVGVGRNANANICRCERKHLSARTRPGVPVNLQTRHGSNTDVGKPDENGTDGRRIRAENNDLCANKPWRTDVRSECDLRSVVGTPYPTPCRRTSPKKIA